MDAGIGRGVESPDAGRGGEAPRAVPCRHAARSALISAERDERDTGSLTLMSTV
jgi:hypothetical protein